jgi:thioredoxin reductase
MARAVIIGDGPGGLSAALFLARNGIETTVLGKDDTPMHIALLNNYLGLQQTPGRDFQQTARAQVQAAGATLEHTGVARVEKTERGFLVTDEAGEKHAADYLIVASGSARDLAVGLGAQVDDSRGVHVDRDGRTAVDRLYAVGRTTRPYKTQAVIAAGDGAAAALDILSRENEKPMRDWDVAEQD